MNYRYLGKLKPQIALKCNILEHKNKSIVVFADRKNHVIERHLKDFGNIEEINFVYENLSEIINNPDYVFYDSIKKGLEYYKKIDDYICVVVRINCNKILKVKSWYPVNENKIKNRKKKQNRLNRKIPL